MKKLVLLIKKSSLNALINRNPYLRKAYNPAQPRGTDGKWTASNDVDKNAEAMDNNAMSLREIQRREKNARKAKAAADRLFPDEKWESIEKGIFLSPRRPVGAKTNFLEEKRDAEILALLGSTVYLIPDNRAEPGNKYDAIVDGRKMEFKNMHGASRNTLEDHFLKSRKQAPNVFMNLENSTLRIREIVGALTVARNSQKYNEKNKFDGGIIILKVSGQKKLIHIKVNRLKRKSRP